jgi:hypothetical protein
MFDAAPGIAAALGDDRVVVSAHPAFGMGLTRPEAYDWRRGWRSEMATALPDVVVVLQGKWDARVAPEFGRPGTAEWARRYDRALDAAAAILTTGGTPVVWLSTPWLSDAASDPLVAAVNAAGVRLARRWRAVSFLDVTGLLAGRDGRYAEFVTTGGRRLHLRKPDGVHLCPDGSAVIGAAVSGALRRVWSLPPAPRSWESGAWRDDGRYYQVEGGSCRT